MPLNNAINANLVSSGGTGVTSFTNNGILIGNGTSSITAQALTVNGQLLIGNSSGSGAPTAGLLTAGTNVTITNGAGSITIASSAPAVPFTGLTQSSSPFYTLISSNTSQTSSGANNVAIGGYAIVGTGTESNTVACGAGALQSLTSGSDNVAVGITTLGSYTSSISNTGFGNTINSGIANANMISIFGGGQSTMAASTNASTMIGYQIKTGGNCTNIGYQASNNTANTSCVFIGAFAGNGLTSTTNSIYIGEALTDSGSISNVIKIGSTGNTNSCFIQGIYNQSYDSSSGIQVFINSSNKLGTSTSSIRYKENIENIGILSKKIFQLRPVAFIYKEDQSRSEEYGLIAEEVDEILPSLVIKGEDGSPESVKYHSLPVLLLNELIEIDNLINKFSEII